MCLVLPAVLVAALTISTLYTMGFYWQSRAILIKSRNAIIKVGGTRSGNSYQPSVVIKLFVKTSLLSITVQLFIVIYNYLVMTNMIDINSGIQFIFTVHVIPGVTIINTGCILFRLAKSKLKYFN